MVGDELWWTLARPTEGGRSALVRRRPDGESEVALPEPWNVRSRLMEYGGTPWHGAARAGEGPLIVFVHFADQRLYAYEPDTERRAAAADSALSGRRGAALGRSPDRPGAWRSVVRPGGVHRRGAHRRTPGDRGRTAGRVGGRNARSRIRELSDGRHRFVTGPRLSPDGGRAVWIGWDHPRMPWDGTELILADIGADGLAHGRAPSPAARTESIAQAEWAADGQLLFALRPHAAGGTCTGVDPEGRGRRRRCARREEEFAGPLWQIGRRWFQPLDSGLVAVVHGRGATALGILDPRERRTRRRRRTLDRSGARRSPPTAAESSGVAASPRTAYELVELDTATGRARVIGRGRADAVDPAYYPEPRDPHLHRPRRPGHPRARLPAAQPGPHRRPTANRRPMWSGRTAARPQRLPRARPGDRLLHLARHRRRQGRLRRLHRLRPRLPQPAARAVGRRRRRGLRRGRPRPGRRRRRRPPPPRDPGRQRGRLDHGRLPRRHRRVRVRHHQLPVLDLAGWLGVTHDFESRTWRPGRPAMPRCRGRYRERSPGQQGRTASPRRSCCSRAWTT